MRKHCVSFEIESKNDLLSVNFLSKFEVSVMYFCNYIICSTLVIIKRISGINSQQLMHTTVGMNGGSICCNSNASQSKCLKNRWLLICESSAEYPNRFIGSFTIKPLKRKKAKPKSISVVTYCILVY